MTQVCTKTALLIGAMLLIACWLGASVMEQGVFRAAYARSQAKPALPKLFDIERVAEGVYAAVARPAAQINCNAAIFEQSDHLLIVDTHSKPSAVNALVAQIKREVSTKPVGYVVNSHFHWDHSQGNPAHRREGPSPKIIASETTRRLLTENAMIRVRAYSREAERAMESWRAKLAAAKAAEEKTFYRAMIAESEAFLAEMKNYTPELPHITFDRDLILRDKAHDLHLAFRGRGHTAGDIVVHCPQRRVVATGDLVHSFVPTAADSYPHDWPRTLDALAEFDFQHVIGGHGPVQRTRERLPQTGALIAEVTAIIERDKAAGKSLAQIQQEHLNPTMVRGLRRVFQRKVGKREFGRCPVTRSGKFI